MHVGCTIRLCHLCDPKCQTITVSISLNSIAHHFSCFFQPPRTCNDNRADDYEAMWNSSSRVKNLCFPEPSTTENLNLNFGNSPFQNVGNIIILLLVFLLR